MPYNVEQLRERVTRAEGADARNRAVLQQERIKLHAVKQVSVFNFGVSNRPLSQFLAMVDNTLPHDKAVLFKSLFRFPLYTNGIVETAFTKLWRVWDGRDVAYNVQFVSSEARDDWARYRKEELNEPEVWKTKGWNFFQTEINSVLVVDLPRVQEGDRPAPYFYWLPITDVLAHRARPDTGQMDYIVFRRPGRVIAIDDTTYRVWEGKKADRLEGAPSVEALHGLGYCPARFFWDRPLSLSDPDVKESPLSTVLEKLDWAEFFHVSKRQLDLMGAYPILSGFEPNCNYSNAENGDYCDGGFLKDRQGHYQLDNAGSLVRCPKCGQRRTVGPGSFVEIPIPKDGQPDLRNPVQILKVDHDSLDYNVREEERLRLAIIDEVVGQEEIVTNRDAYNEQQVRAGFEDATSVLRKIKAGFESAIRWVDETICRLRYADEFLSLQVDLGSEFYLATAEDLRKRYTAAKEAGASAGELDAMLDVITETEYRNNPLQIRRMRLLAELEPYRNLSVDEVLTLMGKGMASPVEARVKLRFADYIRRFERENINILQFGELMPYERKIDAIAEELARYASEELASINTQPLLTNQPETSDE